MFARTWLADDMLRDDQTPLIDDGSPWSGLAIAGSSPPPCSDRS
jgi:hypothetical protein